MSSSLPRYDATGGSCSINKSIFSQGYLIQNRFTILRSPPARPIFDGDIMSRLHQISGLDFPLIETNMRGDTRLPRTTVARFFVNDHLVSPRSWHPTFESRKFNQKFCDVCIRDRFVVPDKFYIEIHT